MEEVCLVLTRDADANGSFLNSIEPWPTFSRQRRQIRNFETMKKYREATCSSTVHVWVLDYEIGRWTGLVVRYAASTIFVLLQYMHASQEDGKKPSAQVI